jgi:hypothetical protein
MCYNALEVVLCVPEVLEGVRCMPLCRSEAVEGVLCLLEVLEVMRCVQLCMLEAVEGIHYVLELLEVVFHVFEVLEGVRWCCSICWSPWTAYAMWWSC